METDTLIKPIEVKPQNVRMRTADAAEYCGLSKSTFDKYRLTGEGPAFLKLGRAVVYDLVDLDAWMDSNRFTSTSDFEINN